MQSNQELFTILSYTAGSREKKETSRKKKASHSKVNRMIEFRNISVLMISVTILSLSAINYDAITVYASDWLGMTEQITQITQDEQRTSIAQEEKSLSAEELQEIIRNNQVKQLAIHPVTPVASMLKQKINNYTMPFNTLPPVNKILIPGINVDAPIIANYNKTPEQVEKGDFDEELLKGVAKYPATAMPGQKGHTLLFGHSSSEAWNRSRYNAIFAQLPKLEAGNEFSVVRNGQLYEYQIVEKDIISPAAIQTTFNKRDSEETNYLTLITCRPVGTTKERMVVTAQLMNHKDIAPTVAYTP